MTSGLFGSFGIRFFEFFDDLQHAVTPGDGIIDEEFKRCRVFQNDCPRHQPLDAFAVLRQQSQPALLLIGSAKDADKDDCRMEIPRHIDVIHRDQSGFADGKLPKDDLANLALEKFANALDSQRRHELKTLGTTGLGCRIQPSKLAMLKSQNHSFWATFSTV